MRPFFFPLFRRSLDEPLEQASIDRQNYLLLNRRAVVCAGRLTSTTRSEDIAQEALAGIFSPGDGTEPRRWDPRAKDLYDHTMSTVGSVATTANLARDRGGKAMKGQWQELSSGNKVRGKVVRGEVGRSPEAELEGRSKAQLWFALLDARLEGDDEALDVLRAKKSGLTKPREIAHELGLSSTQVDNALKRIAHHVSAVLADVEKREKETVR